MQGTNELAFNPSTLKFAENFEVLKVSDAELSFSALVTANTGIFYDRFYSTPHDTYLDKTNISANVLYTIPVVLQANHTMNRIGIAVNNAKSNQFIRLGLYKNNNGIPGELLIDSGIVPTNTAANKELVINYATTGTYIWATCVASSTISVVSFQDLDIGGMLGRTTVTKGEKISCLTADYTFGPLPEVFPTTTHFTGESPYIWLRKVSD
ncbi:MAG: hypothetical protein HC836_31230 [Richelia sp. RM2_1_2]|nr:hypothetical protein [Richelia sp. RM2_1_2]